MVSNQLLAKVRFNLSPVERKKAPVFTPKSSKVEAEAGAGGGAGAGSGDDEGRGAGGASNVGGVPTGRGSGLDSYGVWQAADC